MICQSKRVLCVSAVIGLMLVGCATSPQAKRDKYVARGKALVEKKDYLRAILEFRNAIRVKPGDAESYYQIGITYLATNDYRTAYAALKKAVELDPKHRDAQLRLAQLLTMTNVPAMLADAQGRLQALLAENGESPDVLNTLAFTELQLGKTESAIRNYETVLARYPGQLTASIMLARTKLSQNDPKGAETILRKACDDAPKSADARRVLAEFYIDQKQLPAAEAELKKALELDANSGATLLAMGQLQLSLGRKDAAEESFKRLRSIEGYKHLYGSYLLNTGRTEEAVREFQVLAKADPDDRQSRTRLVAVYRRLKRLKEADAVLGDALKRNGKDADALLQRGEIALEAKRFGDAEADFNRVLKLEPKAAEAHYLIAKLHEARGDKRLYRQELGEALSLSPALAIVRVELARDLLLQNAGQSALEVLDAAPAYQKDSPEIMVQRNWALWNLQNYVEMRKGVDLALSRGPSPEALLQDGMLKLRTGDRQGARAAAQQALNLAPDDVRPLRIMNQSYAPQESAVALQNVKIYAAQRPNSAPVQEFLGLMLVREGKFTEARTAFAAAKAAAPAAVSPDFSVTQIDVLENRLDDAHKRLQTILTADGGNLQAREWLATVEWMRGNQDAALEQFQKVADTDSTNAQAANNTAYLLIERKNQIDQGLKYAQKAVELVPERAAYCDTLGWALYRKGLYSEAVKYLERADSGGGDAIAKYHLAMAYAKSGDMTHAKTAFQAAKKLNGQIAEAKAAEGVLGSVQ